jgi:DNA polymerase-1
MINPILVIDADTYIYKACVVGNTLKEKIKIVNTMFNDVFIKLNSEYCIAYIGENSLMNFRKKLYPDYKINRINQIKPAGIDEVSRYLQEYKGFNLISGIEADDAVSITAQHLKEQQKEYIIISNDKDLLQIEGRHYNPNLLFLGPTIDVDYIGHIERLKNGKVFSTGRYRLFSQVLQGDSSDNIKGLPGIGEVGAYKLLKSANITSDLSNIQKEEVLKNICFDKYKEIYPTSYKNEYFINNTLCRLLTDTNLIQEYGINKYII